MNKYHSFFLIIIVLLFKQYDCSLQTHEDFMLKPKLLLIFFSQLRTFQKTWRNVQSALNFGDFEVDILVISNISSRCGFHECDPKWKILNDDDFIKSIRNTYDTAEFNFLGIDQSTERVDNSIYRGLTGAKVGNISKGGMAVVYPGLKNFTNNNIENFLSDYHHVLMLRPDVVFTNTLNITEVCARRRGFNLIMSPYNIDCFVFLRESDFGFLACDPLSVLDYFHPTSTCESYDGCQRGHDDPPELPHEFQGSWKHTCWRDRSIFKACEQNFCHQVLTFQQKGKRLGNLNEEEVFLTIHRSAHGDKVKTFDLFT